VETTTEAPTPGNLRRAALGPYRDLVQRLAPLEDGTIGAGETQLDPGSLQLEHWATAALHGVLSRDPERRPSWGAVLLEGVAYLLKLAEDLERADRGLNGSPRERADCRRLLGTNAALGLALLEECQRVVDALVLAGQIADAKKLSGFRNRIVQTVNQLKDRLGEQAFQEAEVLSRALVDPGGAAVRRERGATVVPGPDSNVRPPATHRRPVTRVVDAGQAAERRPILKPMTALLATLVFAWVVVVLPRLDRTRLPVLEKSQLPANPAIGTVVARPPSLFITVDTGAWQGMGAADRLQLVHDVGAAAAAAGYHGAVLQDPAGRPVAQWLKKTGARLTGN
jgi:hypothetical protein